MANAWRITGGNITLDGKLSVAYASTSALPANTYANGTAGVGATLTGNANGPLVIDSVTIVTGQAGQRVLVAGEATSANNGWYVITHIGVVAVSPYILTRATESDTGAEIGAGYITSIIAPNTVTPGTANNGKVFISVAADPFTVGTTALTFSAVGSAYTAGSGITRTGQSFSADAAVVALMGGTTAFTKGQKVTAVALSVFSNVVISSAGALDISLSNNFSLQLQNTTGQTLQNPTAGMVAGYEFSIDCTQSASAASTFAYGSYYTEASTGVAPAAPTTLSATFTLVCRVIDATHIKYIMLNSGVA